MFFIDWIYPMCIPLFLKIDGHDFRIFLIQLKFILSIISFLERMSMCHLRWRHFLINAGWSHFDMLLKLIESFSCDPFQTLPLYSLFLAVLSL